jgi:AbrB family looped-hinge helix DNA binding protein
MANRNTLRTTVTQKGQTVVPAEIRKRLGIGPNSNLIWASDGKIITVMVVPKDPIGSLRGSTAGKGLRNALILKRKQDERKK